MDRNRRNFLRENKLSLRELQRVTCKNRMQQQQEQVMREQRYNGRRSQSQQRNNYNGLDKQINTRCPSLTRVPSGCVVRAPVAGSIGDGGNHIVRNSVSRTGSTNTVKSVHKQVQTEDIQDEQFLYDALKRCTTNDCQSHLNRLQLNITPRSNHTALDAQSRNSFYPPPVNNAGQAGCPNTTENSCTTRQHPHMQDQYENHHNNEQPHDGLQKENTTEDDDEDVVGSLSAEPLYVLDSSSKYNLAPTPRSQQHFSNGYNMVESDGLPPTTTMQSSYEPPDQQKQQQKQSQARQYRMQPHV
ncbi:PREDICTED: uncharacterized protein LOC108357530, partial [Rhagoletis zephyria]|uniref:uncharacterized protein LOC108357530 n=1 Tax=Rhagoletis zephyria TaxID=28612 RepID=UPI0008113D10